jgi:mono/diheme cytochrome c family protein
MKKFFKVLFIIVLVIILAVAGIATYVKTALPNVGSAPDIKVDTTPARIERGKYLANSVVICMECHSQHDNTAFGSPILPGTLGEGGDLFGKQRGFPGEIYAKNITPYNLSNWTDGEIFRVITTGVTKTGKALFPLMPYHAYGKIDQEDVYSIIAYIRTLPTIKNDVPATTLDFPLNFIVNTIPVKAALTVKPDTNNSVAYGLYLVTSAACADCHSKVKQGNVIPGTEFGGGREFGDPNGNIVTSSNITPDNQTGIGPWTKEAFIQRFKQYAPGVYTPQKIAPTDFATVMPWLEYATMTEKDLGAMYDYLHTLQPISNKVEKVRKRG